MMSKNAKIAVVLIVLALFITFLPLFLLSDADFEGTDTEASEMVGEINGGYEPWAEPLAEKLVGGELPGEIETLIFCLQTGVGVGVMAFAFGWLAARKKYGPKTAP